jgi:hypothetical protein
MARNIVTGSLTGGLYKSTLGFRPMVVGTLAGGLIITGITYSINGLNNAGLISFRMDV